MWSHGWSHLYEYSTVPQNFVTISFADWGWWKLPLQSCYWCLQVWRLFWGSQVWSPPIKTAVYTPFGAGKGVTVWWGARWHKNVLWRVWKYWDLQLQSYCKHIWWRIKCGVTLLHWKQLLLCGEQKLQSSMLTHFTEQILDMMDYQMKQILFCCSMATMWMDIMYHVWELMERISS